MNWLKLLKIPILLMYCFESLQQQTKIRLSIFVIVIICVFSSSTITAQMNDTTSYFSKNSKVVYYNNPFITMQGTRFSINRPCRLHSIELVLMGEKSSEPLFLRVFGEEGGNPVPIYEHDLIDPIPIEKKDWGLDTIRIDFEQEIIIQKNHFYLILENNQNNCYLVSDAKEKETCCTNQSGEVFTNQVIKTEKGGWKSAKYSYALTAIIEPLKFKYKDRIFEDVTEDIGLAEITCDQKGLTVFDINNDEYLDILTDGKLYLNNKGESFEEATEEYSIFGKPQVHFFIDMNLDGLIDILFLNSKNEKEENENILFLNKNNTFEGIKISLPMFTDITSFSIADINFDNYPDLITTQGCDSVGNGLPNYLLVNDKSNGFIDQTELLYKSKNNDEISMSSIWTDIDEDYDLDLLITNLNSNSQVFINGIYTNKGFKRYSFEQKEQNKSSNIYKFTTCLEDMNNDGIVETITPFTELEDIKKEKSLVVYQKSEDDYTLVHFTDEAFIKETNQLSSIIGDINNDGKKDILFTTDLDCRSSDLYIQDEDKGYYLITHETDFNKKTIGPDGIFIDFNNDGMLDLLSFEQDNIKLYRNNFPKSNNYIQVEFPNESEKSQYGTKVYTYSGNMTQTSYLISGERLKIQAPFVLHFGLDDKEKLDSLQIIYPDGDSKKYFDIPANKKYEISELEDYTKNDSFISSLRAYPNPFIDGKVGILFHISDKSDVDINIIDLKGNIVKTIFNGVLSSGNHELFWDGSNYSNLPSPSGVYMVKVTTNSKDSYCKIIKSN